MPPRDPIIRAVDSSVFADPDGQMPWDRRRGQGGQFFNQLSSSFDGSTESMKAATGTPFAYPKAQPFSAGCLLKTAVTGTGMVIFGKDTSAGNGWRAQILTTDSVRVMFLGGGGNPLRVHVPLTGVTGGGWYHFAFTYDGSVNASGLLVYGNGTLVGPSFSESALTGEMVDLAEPLQIGAYHSPAPATRFSGKLDEMWVTPRTLSAAQIAAIHNGGVPGNVLEQVPGGFDGYWRMGDGDLAATVLDRSGNGNDLTLVAMDASNYTTDVP